MAGKLNIPKFVDFRSKVMRHKTLKFPVLSLTGKTTIAIHHSLTKQGLGGSNAEGYARYHVHTNGWPSIGYHYVIEPDGTIKWCNDIETRAYHVGDHNNYAVGICLTGDFRTEKPTAAQEESLRNLVNGLKKTYSHLKYVKGHSEFSGYEWKPCPVFDYKKVLAEKGTVTKPTDLPNTYTIQQGDTLWSISKGLKLTVDDLLKANPGIKATQLQIGQKINLGKAVAEKPSQSKPPVTKPTKTVAQMAKEVMDGKHGNGHKNRRKSLGISAAEYEKVRAEVNRIANGGKTSSATKPQKTIKQMADEVIKGLHGNGHAQRQKSLGVNNATYQKVRAEVNKRL